MIKNLTKSIIISEQYNLCNNMFSKSIGLMFSKKEFIPLIFVFKKEKIIPLHMLFVFFPIDVLFLDKDKKVVEIKQDFMPFSFYRPKNKTMYVVELPQNYIKKYNVDIGDQIKF